MTPVELRLGSTPVDGLGNIAAEQGLLEILSADSCDHLIDCNHRSVVVVARLQELFLHSLNHVVALVALLCIEVLV